MGHGVDDQQGRDHHWRAHQDLTDRQGHDQQGQDCCGRERDQQEQVSWACSSGPDRVSAPGW